MIAILGTLTVTIGLIQCTKDNVNASLIDRDLVSVPDSTVFASFYDTVLISKHDLTPDANDIISTTGVQSIVRTYCASPSCHGGNIGPKLTNYAEITSLVEPGNPEGSKLMELITTVDVAKAMPPINYGSDLSTTEKTKIYNWIRNGAKERPNLVDFRPAAISLIVNGCGSANCHNQATVGGAWARRNLITFAPGDTVSYTYINPGTGSVTIYAQLKEPRLSEVWNAYKDSVRKFYADTVANASFRPGKTFSAPVTASSVRGPLNSYDDILFDINYPKALRSHTRVIYTDPVTLKNYYVQGDNLAKSATSTSSSPTSSLISRIDSTIVVAAPRTQVFNASQHGDMAYGDGGFTPYEIALVKAWYFADPNVPDVWKYGLDGNGIFKYRKSGPIIKK
jgi:hypothetical protein